MVAPEDSVEGRLLPHERHLRILEQARSRSRVEVSALAEELEVTTETIRRDLSILERQGQLRRVHGGAVHVQRLGYEPTVSARREHQASQKSRIGRIARDYLPDGGSILIDSGTTTLELVRQLPTDQAVFGGHQLASGGFACWSICLRVELMLLGGRIRNITGAAVGSWTASALASLRVDVAFIGANGITPEAGLTTPDQAEAEIKRAMVDAAAQVVCLADYTKVGRTQLCRFASLSEVDVLITDNGLDAGTGRRAVCGRARSDPRMIVTLTPNPSVDRTVTLPRLDRGAVLRATESREDPGGKGLNVSRALAANRTAEHRSVPGRWESTDG